MGGTAGVPKSLASIFPLAVSTRWDSEWDGRSSEIAGLYFSFSRVHLAVTGAGRFSRTAVTAAARSKRKTAKVLLHQPIKLIS